MAEAAMETSEGNKDAFQTLDYFNSFPDELLILIFSYLPHTELPRCSMVSRRWLRISSDESLWNRTNLRNAKIPLASLAKLIQRGIRHLDMRSAEVADPEPWSKCFGEKYKCKLEDLDARVADISSRGLAHLLRPCRKLLRFQSMSTDVNRSGCEALGFNPELQLLELSDLRGLDAQGLTAILKGCPKLEDLNLSRANLSLPGLEALTANLSPSITTLSLYSCSNHLQDRLERCPNLRYLNISFNENLTDAAFERVRTLKHLEELVEDGEFSWNYLDDDFEDDYLVEDSDGDYDFDHIFHADSDDDDVFAPAMNLDDLDDLEPPVDMDDSEADDDIVDIVSDSDADTTDEGWCGNEDTDCEVHSTNGSDTDNVEVKYFDEGVNLNGVHNESSVKLFNNESSGDDDVDVESFDGDDDLGDDEVGDYDDGGDYEDDDYDL